LMLLFFYFNDIETGTVKEFFQYYDCQDLYLDYLSASFLRNNSCKGFFDPSSGASVREQMEDYLESHI